MDNLLSLNVPKFILRALRYQEPCDPSNLSASNSEPAPSFNEDQIFAQEPNEVSEVPDPRIHMLSLSVNANCLTPPKLASVPEEPFRSVNTKCLEPPSANPSAVLFLVSAITPETNELGDGFDVVFVVELNSLSVLPDWPEIPMLYVPLRRSVDNVPALKLLAFR